MTPSDKQAFVANIEKQHGRRLMRVLVVVALDEAIELRLLLRLSKSLTSERHVYDGEV